MMTAENILSEMDRVLTALPSMHVLASQGTARFVVGPSGAFVVGPSGPSAGELLATASRLDQLTAITREALCKHLSWVPFLDALVVTHGDPPRSVSITTVPIDLLHDVLTEGPKVINQASLDIIREAIRASDLDGWRAGILPVDGKIDLCDPVQPTSSR